MVKLPQAQHPRRFIDAQERRPRQYLALHQRQLPRRPLRRHPRQPEDVRRHRPDGHGKPPYFGMGILLRPGLSLNLSAR